MKKILPLEELSIKEIYLDSKETITYKIPIYQRNYAWEENEITALVKDVYDSCIKDSNSPYYIGTLVTYKRGDNAYEVIDGQQRLTTIFLILKALGIDKIRNQLTYIARSLSAETLRKLPDTGNEYDLGIKNGFDYAKKALKEVDEKILEKFKNYFLNKVMIIHYNVPRDVDLNHYFEVMNSRGEQLEKHEIVKSTLSQCLNDKTNDLSTFSSIWEACSEMNVYIQDTFYNNDNSLVFGNQLNSFRINQFDDIPKQSADTGKTSILELLNSKITQINTSSNFEQNDQFQPIIDFPNFLLIVLKLTLYKNYNIALTDFILDDKELLNEFNRALKEVEDKDKFVKTFAFNLLKAKYFLDNYIVHHTFSEKEQIGDNPWQLQSLYKEKNHRYTKNLSSDIDIQRELVHLLSMFEVSFTARQRKNYLLYCLIHLFDNTDVVEYLKFLQKLADKYFYDIYLNKSNLNERKQPLPNAFDGAILLSEGLNLDYDFYNKNYTHIFETIYFPGNSEVPLYVFNYTDYKLWKKYAQELRGTKTKKESPSRIQFFDDLGCSDFELDTFNNFYFSRTRKSLEHFYPQSKAVKDREESETALSVSQINTFGNFAMIGAAANSAGSNWDPKQKYDHYNDSKSDPISVSSLKFKIMMQMCHDNFNEIAKGNLIRPAGMEWNYEDIIKHQNKILNIIL